MKRLQQKKVVRWGKTPDLFAVARELPVSVVEGTHWSALEPARDAVEVEGVLHERVGNCFFLSFLLAKDLSGEEG